jgi:signal peptidase I
MLYLAELRWALIYFVAALTVARVEWLVLPTSSTSWMQYFTLNHVLIVVGAVHAYRIAVRSPVRTARPWYSRWYGLAVILLVPYVTIFSVRTFLYEPFRFPSSSMMPTIEPGSVLIAKKWGYGNYGTYGLSVWRTGISAELARGDIVVFDFPLNPSVRYAKRVVGLPGDTVEYKDRRLTVNGVAVEWVAESSGGGYETRRESLEGVVYRVWHAPGRRSRELRITVPNDSYFVLGDNRDHSNDSRYWGFVPARNVVGRVVYTF